MIDHMKLMMMVQKLPEAERAAALGITRHLSALDSHQKDFAAALALHDFAISQEATGNAVFPLWRVMAGRDAAITLFNFCRTFQGIYESLGLTPTLDKMVDGESMTEGSRNFQESFPRIIAVRHGVAHAAEIAKTPRAVSSNAFTGDYQGDNFTVQGSKDNMFMNCFDGRRFTTTINQEIVSYELSKESLDRVNHTRIKMWEAFQAAASPSQEPQPSS